LVVTAELILSFAVSGGIGLEANLCRTYAARYFVREPAQVARRKKQERLKQPREGFFCWLNRSATARTTT
jgi:hypothetical protein